MKKRKDKCNKTIPITKIYDNRHKMHMCQPHTPFHHPPFSCGGGSNQSTSFAFFFPFFLKTSSLLRCGCLV